MLKKLIDLFFLLVIVLGLSGIVGCASGGGSAGLVQTTNTTPTPTPTTTQPYQTIELLYENKVHGLRLRIQVDWKDLQSSLKLLQAILAAPPTEKYIMLEVI